MTTSFADDSQPIASTPPAETHPLLWSVRRELWENRSIYIAPAAVAALALFGFLLSMATPHRRWNHIMALPEPAQRGTIEMPYDMLAGFLVITSVLVSFFYCLDALYGERRDRSILFWKSLPVSDRATVASKAAVPFVVMPAVVFVVTIATQINMLLLDSAMLLRKPEALRLLWTRYDYVQNAIGLAYCLVTMAFWYAPLYGWLMMISAWAKRSPFLWGVLPWLAVAAVEKITLGTAHVGLMLRSRFIGWFTVAFVPHAEQKTRLHALQAMTPLHYLTAPGLWLGLLFAAIFFAAAVRLRRYREPI